MHQKLKGKTSKISSRVQDLREILRFLQHERKTSWVYFFFAEAFMPLTGS